jgi:hypothetical protein
VTPCQAFHSSVKTATIQNSQIVCFATIPRRTAHQGISNRSGYSVGARMYKAMGLIGPLSEYYGHLDNTEIG